MDIKTLQGLEKLNQLALTDEQRAETLAFFDLRAQEWAALGDIDTENVERMVHVMPLDTVVREDVVDEPFSRDDLQAQAPDSWDGYWQVPYVLE